MNNYKEIFAGLFLLTFAMLTTGMMAITRTINFQAETGHSYQVRCGSYGSRKTFWIIDKSSGEVVGGTAPP
jgi:hypothetical protein